MSFSSAAWAEVTSKDQLATTLGGLIIVIGVILGLTWLLKRMRVGQMLGGSSKIKVVSQMAIGQRERLAVVDVNGEQVLIGITAQQITLLKSLEHPIELETPTKSTFKTVMEHNQKQ